MVYHAHMTMYCRLTCIECLQQGGKRFLQLLGALRERQLGFVCPGNELSMQLSELGLVGPLHQLTQEGVWYGLFSCILKLQVLSCSLGQVLDILHKLVPEPAGRPDLASI